MGQSTDGILAYGYDLGEDFGLGAYGTRPWLDDNLDESLPDQAARRLFGLVGVHIEPGSYFDPDKLLAAAGVQFIEHCSDRAPMWILAAKSQEASRGYPKPVDLTLPDDADERLAWAVEQLGLKVDGPPKWLLASYWG